MAYNTLAFSDLTNSLPQSTPLTDTMSKLLAGASGRLWRRCAAISDAGSARTHPEVAAPPEQVQAGPDNCQLPIDLQHSACQCGSERRASPGNGLRFCQKQHPARHMQVCAGARVPSAGGHDRCLQRRGAASTGAGDRLPAGRWPERHVESCEPFLLHLIDCTGHDYIQQ